MLGDASNLESLSNTNPQVSKPISFRSKSNKKLDDFNFVENLQKLGLDDSRANEQNLTNVQGSYLSFLLLRHLRIRDLKRQVRDVNQFYFLNFRIYFKLLYYISNKGSWNFELFPLDRKDTYYI